VHGIDDRGLALHLQLLAAHENDCQHCNDNCDVNYLHDQQRLHRKKDCATA